MYDAHGSIPSAKPYTTLSLPCMPDPGPPTAACWAPGQLPIQLQQLIHPAWAGCALPELGRSCQHGRFDIPSETGTGSLLADPCNKYLDCDDMEQAMLISGLAEARCREFFGVEQWHEFDMNWCSPEKLDGITSTATVIWLYRAPWTIPDLSGDSPADTSGQYLSGWQAKNRRILKLRYRLADRLMLVNIDRIPARLACSELAGADLPADAAVTTPEPGLLGQAFEWCAPQYWDTYEALEAASWLPSGEPQCRGQADTSEAQLDTLFDQLLEQPRLRRQLDEQYQAAEKHRSGLEQEQRQTSELKEENELLLIQLHQVQEELEQYYLKNLEMDKTITSSKTTVAKLQGEVKTLKAHLTKSHGEIKALQALKAHLGKSQDEVKALKVQLHQMQNELRCLRVRLPEPLPASKALVPAGEVKRNHRVLHKLGHWIPGPAKRTLHRSRSRKDFKDQVNLIRTSEWFDGQWYLEQYPDVRAANIDPAEHYYSQGWKENRNPGKGFNTAYYVRNNPDIAENGLNPLWHFIRFGHREGRLPRKP